MTSALRLTRAWLVALERQVGAVLDSNADPTPVIASLRELVASLPQGDPADTLHPQLRHIEGARGFDAQRLAMRDLPALLREVHRVVTFEVDAPLEDVTYAAFLRAASKANSRLTMGVTISVDQIGELARLSPNLTDRAAARALDDQVAYVSEIDDQPHAIQIHPDRVRDALEILSSHPATPAPLPAAAPTGSRSTAAPICSKHPVDIGILTIRNDEFEALLKVFPEKERIEKGAKSSRHYNIRRANAGEGQYLVAIVRQAEPGTGEAQAITRDLIEELKPRLLLVVGIAGAVPHNDFSLGDVVLSTRFHDYTVHSEKPGEQADYALGGGPIDRAIQGGVVNLRAIQSDFADWTKDLPPRPPVDVADTAKYKGSDDGWKRRVRESLERHFVDEGARSTPIFIDGPIASSDGLIKDPDVVIKWLQTARSLLAIEMESAGVYRAANARVPMLAIRGVSDIVGYERDERWTKYACATAAAFTRAYLSTTPIPPPGWSYASRDPAPLEPPSGETRFDAVVPSSFFKPIATLASKDGSAVATLSWQLRLEFPSAFEGTKAELVDALRAATVMYDMGNFGRSARWPLVLVQPGSTPAALKDGTTLWSHTYDGVASNERGDEQLGLVRDGSVIFQRDTLWDAATLALDFGQLGHDTLLFVAFASQFASLLGITSEPSVSLCVHNPRCAPPTVAHFRLTPLEAEEQEQIASLASACVLTRRPLPLSTINDPKRLAAFCKRLLDGVANEFTLGTNHSPSSGAFLSISLPSVERLIERLRVSFKAVLQNSDAEAMLGYKKTRITQELHQYELVATLKNVGSNRFEDWDLELEMPTLLLDPSIIVGIRVAERSDAKRTVFRATSKAMGKQIYPGDDWKITVAYRVDSALYDRQGEWFTELVKVRAYVAGKLVATCERPMRDLQCF